MVLNCRPLDFFELRFRNRQNNEEPVPGRTGEQTVYIIGK